jgi:PPOX class probable F420-dependent enzyme
MLSDQAREIIAAPTILHVGIVDADGRPHVSAVWGDVDADGRIVFNSAEGRVKTRHLAVGSPVCISATRIGQDYEAITVRGTVIERSTEDGDAVIDALAKKYMGVDSYPLRQPGEVRVTFRVEAE